MTAAIKRIGRMEISEPKSPLSIRGSAWRRFIPAATVMPNPSGVSARRVKASRRIFDRASVRTGSV
jgi:hypothetical protein